MIIKFIIITIFIINIKFFNFKTINREIALCKHTELALHDAIGQ